MKNQGLVNVYVVILVGGDGGWAGAGSGGMKRWYSFHTIRITEGREICYGCIGR